MQRASKQPGEGTVLNCVMAKRANERDSARKIFDILLNRFGSGVQGHQAMMKFEKRRQRDDESIDKFLDDFELLRRSSNPDERISERNLAIASKFMDGVKSEELKTMLATHFTLSLEQVPTPDDLRMKSREYLLIKPRAQNRYSNYGNYSGTNTGANSSWYKPRDDMDKRRSFANCGSMDHHVSACSAYKQNMKAKGYFLDDVDATDEDHEEYVRGLIMKYGPRCFFCILEGHFKSDCTQFWDAVADAKHPRHEDFYERLEEKQANQSEIKDGFSFLDKETYDKQPLTRWLDKSGHPISGHPDLPVETAAEIKVLARGEPVPLDLLVRSNLVQQELTRLGINSIALLNRTVNVAPDVMGKLRDLLDREVDRHDREWMETMQRLTVTERTEKRPVSIRSRGVERVCRSIVNQM